MKAANRTSEVSRSHPTNNDCLHLMERGCEIPARLHCLDWENLIATSFSGDRRRRNAPSSNVRSPFRTIKQRLFSFFKHGNWKPTNLTADDPRDHKCHRLPSVIERPPIDGRTGNLWKAYQSNRRWVWDRERGRGQMTSIIRLHPSATRPIHLLTRCSENSKVIL